MLAWRASHALSIQRSALPILLEVDSIQVVNILKDEAVDRSAFASLVAEIKYLLSLHKTCITHINRSKNIVSDYLANFARTENKIVIWLGSGPPEAVDVWKVDCNEDSD